MHLFTISFVVATCTFAKCAASAAWTDLRITWGPPDPIPWHKAKFFLPQPRTVGEIDTSKYTAMENFCNSDGTCKGPFCGQRYQLKNDPAVRLLYDPNGYIIAIQTSVPKAKWSPGTEAMKLAVSDGSYWTLTAYFVDPTTACSGRSAVDYNNYGTGHGLWIQQNNNDLTKTMHIPDTVDAMDAAHNGDWFVKGKCFYTMGLHYWWNLSPNMPCDNFMPLFILYNGGKLDSFGWAVNSGSTPLGSPRYEHPTASVTPLFMNGAPDCLSTDPAFANLNTMHIFFNNGWHTC